MGIVSNNIDRHWPNGEVPYEIDSADFPPGSMQRMVINDAIAAWSHQTAVRLIRRDAAIHPDYIEFREHTDLCASHIGRQGGKQQVVCDLNDSDQARIADHSSKTRPAIAAFGGALHMLHLGEASNNIWHSTFDGSIWSDPVQIPGQQSKATPALAVFNGQIHMVHLGDSSNNLWHSVFDPVEQEWSTNVLIAGQQSKAAPALAVFGGDLHMVHLGNSSNNIWRAVFDPVEQEWLPNVQVDGQRSKATPTLAEHDGGLHLVYLGDSSNDLWHSVFDATEWSPPAPIDNQQSKASPAIASFGNRLYTVHLGESSNHLWLSMFDFDEWSESYGLPGQFSQAPPAIAEYEDRLHMVHLGDKSPALWHSRIDQSVLGHGTFGIAHEIGHAVGLFHEQSREDRDNFVIIELDNVVEGKKHNFDKHIDESEDSGRYDYESLMHYGRSAAAKDRDSFKLPFQQSEASVAVAELNGQIHMVHLGDSSNDIYHSIFDFGEEAWTLNVRIPNQQSKAPPALAVQDGLLHMVHLGNSSNSLWHSVFDPVVQK